MTNDDGVVSSGNPPDRRSSQVAFVIGDHTAIEVKAQDNVSVQDLKSLTALNEERRFRSMICVCLEARPRKVGAVAVLPYSEFLSMLWDNGLRAVH